MAKKIIVTIFLISTLIITGCSQTQTPEDLTQPPRLEGDSEDIRMAIQEYLPQNTRPVIPPTKDDEGSYIKRKDLDGDGEKEAIVFYTLETEEHPLRILVLKKTNSKWINMPEIKIEGQELDQVTFKDLNGDGGLEIIIGSKIKYSPDKDITVYQMQRKELKAIFNNSYSEIIVDDLNDDELSELLLLKSDKENNRSFGEVYKYKKGEITIIDEVRFNDRAEINYAEYDYLSQNTKGILLSTTVDEKYMNIYMMKLKNDKLVNLLRNSLVQNKMEARAQILMPRDIDQDGVIDFAMPNKLQDDGQTDLINWVTEWYAYDGKDKIELKKLNYYDEKLNFTFKFPIAWKNKLTITNLTKNENTVKQEEYIKVEYKPNKERGKIHLFTVYVYDKDKLKRAESNQISKDYKQILEDSNRIYYIYNNSDIEDSELNNEITRIEQTFKLLES